MRRVWMIPSNRTPDHVSCLQLGSTRERVYCFWLVRSIKRIFPALGPVPEHWLRGRLPTFSHMATPLVLYPGFIDETNFPRILTPRARYPQDPSTILTRSRPWTLPGSPGMYRRWRHPAHVSCAHLSLGLDKTNFPRIPENIFILSSGRI